jgi:cytochrome c oxidase cbb3-type subunit 3
MSDAKLVGHSYDGIEELDNNLPGWWLATFYGAILFSVIYVAYYHIGSGPTLNEEYARLASQRKIEKLQASASGAQGPTEDELLAMVGDPSVMKHGGEVYSAKCRSCHGPQGQGGIGPNLTDDYYLHGGTMVAMWNVIEKGVLEKGMPPWGALLSRDELQHVTAFVKSIRGSNPPNAKEPQGKKE